MKWTDLIIKLCFAISIASFSAAVSIPFGARRVEQMKVEAIQRGHAEYFIVNTNTGATQWRWK